MSGGRGIWGGRCRTEWQELHKQKGNFKYITHRERREDYDYKWIINEEAAKGSNKKILCN